MQTMRLTRRGRPDCPPFTTGAPPGRPEPPTAHCAVDDGAWLNQRRKEGRGCKRVPAASGTGVAATYTRVDGPTHTVQTRSAPLRPSHRNRRLGRRSAAAEPGLRPVRHNVWRFPGQSWAVLPPRLFGYFAAIRGRHIVATQPNRGLRPGTAGRRSGDTINFLGQPETRLRQ